MNKTPPDPNATDGRELRSARLFSADIVFADGPSQRIVVKDVSARGCGARADATPPVGTRVSLSLHGIGWIDGTVGWVERGRFGIRFDQPIDVSKVVRAPKSSGDFVVRDLHKPIVDSKRPGLGSKS